MKRLIVCCDGTWNDRHRTTFPTNVAKLIQAILPQDAEQVEQKSHYIRGIGTDHWLEWLPGGAFGWGINQDILTGYTFLSQHYQAGDQVYLFGFSRGAYTVRSLAGFIHCSGLLQSNKLDDLRQAAYDLYRAQDIKPSSPEAMQFRQVNGDRVPITFLGCWDTVGALGIPDLVSWLPINEWINRRYRFHDEELGSIIQTACHAVAIDERRRVLDSTPMIKSQNEAGQHQVVKQAWFPGVHGCVGGGKEINRGLSDEALIWMANQAGALGLAYDLQRVEQGVQPDHTSDYDRRLGVLRLSGLIDRDIQQQDTRFNDLHISTKKRWRDVSNYRPSRLIELFQNALDTWIEP